MNAAAYNLKSRSVIERADFSSLFEALRKRGYEVVGPTRRDGAVIYDTLNGVEDLPLGWTDDQAAGSYRLKPRSDQALFGYLLGPDSWKKFLFPASQRLFRARRQGKTVEFLEESAPSPRRAFLGVRACEVQAILVQDRIFLEGRFVDPGYQQRRENAFIVAVNCREAGATCFCGSMESGPRVKWGFDLALTEVIEPDRHYFFVETGTMAGADVLGAVPHRPATKAEERAAWQLLERAAARMGRTLDTTGLKDLLYAHYEHPRWEHVAGRCLTCGNCTLVCPTCFCTTVDDLTDLGCEAARWRKWDSCFTMEHSYIVGGSIRSSTRSRYRQWLTHKLATWLDQFGVSGCTGCGRCITWCPVGIDLTEEVQVLRGGARDAVPV